ncbi:hydantoinase/oxoprolinase family protein [Chloroflexota bacterium]
MRWRIAVDVGGTFTDVIAVSKETGERVLTKVPSSPQNPDIGFHSGIKQILEILNAKPEEINSIFHGTTVITNALIQGEFGRLGLIVTKNYEDILEIARQTVPGPMGAYITWIKPDRVVPRERIVGVNGRVNHNGVEIEALDMQLVRRIAEGFNKQKVQGVAVCLLHSYVNPIHEELIREIFQQELPRCNISISSDVLPEFREWERTITTCLSVAMLPHVRDYFENIVTSTRVIGIDAPLLVMQSRGGVAHPEEVMKRPMTTALSGPAAGALAALQIARVINYDAISFDMGGTSTDICLIEKGSLPLTVDGMVNNYPMRTPMVNINTIGAGGGSIAWISPDRSLKVGPQSAGAVPGPACYDTGGNEATTTDANLVLGRLPDTLAGGIKLNIQQAKRVIGNLANELGLSITETAWGILRIAAENICNGIRQVSIRVGRDPRRCILIAFGGGGSMFGGDIIEALDMKACFVPLNPGVYSAEGLLYADIEKDYVRTLIQREDRIEKQQVTSILSHMEEEARKYLKGENISEDKVIIARTADFRYENQSYEVTVEMPLGSISVKMIEKAVANFHTKHQDLYGYSYEGSQWAELVNLRVNAIGVLSKPSITEIESGGKDPANALEGSREVFFGNPISFVTCSIFSRGKLLSGNVVQGPAIIEQYDSTTIINPDFMAEVDKYGGLNIRRS